MKSDHRGRRILLVDDDRNAILVLSRLLEHHGYEYRTCMAGNECMAMIEQWRPDVLFLDLAMPGMNGFEVAEELRLNADLRPAIVVAVSGYDLNCHDHKLAEAGFDHHLLKPVFFDQIEAILNGIVSID